MSEAVANQLTALGYTVDRISGADRYETAAAIAAKTATVQPIGTTSVAGFPLRTAILATGENFPDALAGGAPAFSGIHPILLTSSSSLSAAAKAQLSALSVQRVIVLGGTSAVSQAVVDDVNALGIQTKRVSGADRGATAADLAGLLVDSLANGGFNYYGSTVAPSATPAICVGTEATNAVLLVSGSSAADAMAAAPHAARCRAPMLIAGSAGTAAFLGGPAGQTLVGVVKAIGGTAAVSAEQLTAAKDAATSATPTATIAATLDHDLIKVDFSEAMSNANGDLTVNNGNDICVTQTPSAALPTTGLAADTCYLVTPVGGATTLYALAANDLNANDVVRVSGFTAAANPAGRAIAPTTFTVSGSAAPLTATVEKAVQGASTFEIVFNQPVSLNNAPANVTITRAANNPVNLGASLTFANTTASEIGTTATVTVSGLTPAPAAELRSGDVIKVETASATRVATAAGTLATPLNYVVPGPGATPTASKVTGVVADLGGVTLLPDPVADHTVVVQANNARPATGAGALLVTYDRGSAAAGASTTAEAVLNNIDGVTTITVKLGKDAGGTVNATSSDVAAALTATGLVTATPSVPNEPIPSSYTPVDAPLKAGTRTLTATVTASKPLTAVTVANIVYDAAGTGFNTEPVAAGSLVFNPGQATFTVKFDLDVGVSAKAAPTNGVSTLRFSAGALTDATAQTNTAHVTSFSAP